MSHCVHAWHYAHLLSSDWKLSHCTCASMSLWCCFVLSWHTDDACCFVLAYRWCMLFCAGIQMMHVVLCWHTDDACCFVLAYRWCMLFCAGIQMMHVVLCWHADDASAADSAATEAVDNRIRFAMNSEDADLVPYGTWESSIPAAQSSTRSSGKSATGTWRRLSKLQWMTVATAPWCTWRQRCPLPTSTELSRVFRKMWRSHQWSGYSFSSLQRTPHASEPFITLVLWMSALPSSHGNGDSHTLTTTMRQHYTSISVEWQSNSMTMWPWWQSTTNTIAKLVRLATHLQLWSAASEFLLQWGRRLQSAITTLPSAAWSHR